VGNVTSILGIALELPLANVGTALQRPATYVGHAREAGSIARTVLNYPLGVLEAAISTGIPTGDSSHDVPVILVHGYGHNRSGWFALNRSLRASGFTSVHTFNYNPFTGDVPRFAAQLAGRVELLRTVTGQDKVHLVGHSLGGLVARWYVQQEGGDAAVHTAVTVASPHEGTWMAAAGALTHGARQLLPNASVIRRLAESARETPVRWVAYYSNLDLLVQPCRSAMISHPALAATNLLMKDHGHLSIQISPRVARSIVEQLQLAS